tara:strand:- start:169 stop:342 length:174 start_codon:yes stop_codon:yes gene_type:complete
MEMHNKKSTYPLFHEFKIIKIGNILFNTNVDDILDQEIEETTIIINQLKDINQFLEV